ncbi:hypothetical protein DFJ73DRAFT_416710 [Zopfochytrium polystomum]|nr:hypothetical protein DFJ73DRAFT_416710 [Zopfochytrium polystomum]
MPPPPLVSRPRRQPHRTFSCDRQPPIATVLLVILVAVSILGIIIALAPVRDPIALSVNKQEALAAALAKVPSEDLVPVGSGLGETKGWSKEIISPGNGLEYPFQGQTVSVHYVGMFVDGRVFDSSRRRQAPYVTTIGVQSVIKGWDEGVPTMSKGEKARFFITPDALVFEIELLDISD